jgi:hypothetical protein
MQHYPVHGMQIYSDIFIATHLHEPYKQGAGQQIPIHRIHAGDDHRRPIEQLRER